LLTKHVPGAIKELIKFMRKRKETKFKEYNFFLGEFKLSKSNMTNEITLTVEARTN